MERSTLEQTALDAEMAAVRKRADEISLIIPQTVHISQAEWMNQSAYMWGFNLSKESLTELIAAAEECADSLKIFLGVVHDPDLLGMSPGRLAEYEHDMKPATRVRAALAKIKGVSDV